MAGAQIIPVLNTTDCDRCVIEIDVEPSYNHTLNEVFYVKRKASKNKNESRKTFDGGDLYIRNGTTTQKVDEKKRGDFSRKVAENAKIRKEQETKLQNRSGSNVDVTLNNAICRGHAKIRDGEYQYIMVVDELDESEHTNFDWIPKIR